jgi:hypothetical protein
MRRAQVRHGCQLPEAAPLPVFQAMPYIDTVEALRTLQAMFPVPSGELTEVGISCTAQQNSSSPP